MTLAIDAAPTGPATPTAGRALFWSGLAPSERTLLDILAETAARHPGAPALDDGTETLTYRALAEEIETVRGKLAAAGIGRGDRVGVRISSGTAELYVAILAVLSLGAAYVPVDADDPAERAELVFGEAGVCAVLGDGGALTPCGTPGGAPGAPAPGDDAWIIFTSGSTGRPKGVAVSHASAAAFVDAEAELFLADEPLGPGDRVLAGLSVAFDASCEEMWLAWRHGACLVPAPRALVRTGVDLGPWLVERRITVVSTVPTLAALWPADALEEVRLLIFGGEACPPELAERVAVEGREVWNTYGPTEATVVACAAQLTGEGPVRIGLPLAGWQLAVVDDEGRPVAMGESGELVIGGVGLARYLDPAKDAEKFAPLPALGWQRAYRSGDLVRAEPDGLLFLGRADEQIKLGGRRIELGEVDAALQALPGVAGGAAAIRTTKAGNQVLVGYVVPREDFDHDGAVSRLREQLPAALVPLLAVVGDLPTRTSGKVDRAALPWPLSTVDTKESLSPTESWLAEAWGEILGVSVTDAAADFFRNGGGSLTAAQLVSRIRTRHPTVSVTDVYRHPRLGELAALLDALGDATTSRREVAPTPRRAGLVQTLLLLPLFTLAGLRWTTIAAAVSTVLARWAGLAWAPSVPWWALGVAWLVLFSPAGRIAIAAGGARLLLRGVRPGTHPRGGRVHLRLWAAERLADASGANAVAGASWMTHYARALGAKVGRDVDLHSQPPVTGLLKLGRGAAVEPEADLSGYWVDGDVVHIGKIRVGAGARVGARSTLLPGARVGKHAEIAAGSTVLGSVPAGQRWAGSPARREGKASRQWPSEAPRRSRRWVAVYGVTSVLLGLLPAIAAVPALAVLGGAVAGRAPGSALGAALAAVPVATVAYLAAYALLVLCGVRALGIGLREGYHPVHSRGAWRVWATERLMDSARAGLFPLYASLFTPVWLRLLGARVGRGVEASTVLAVPKMTKIDSGAFLADDTMVATYELGHGWLHVAPARIGKQAFLGNSGMTAPGRSVPKRGLVGVLSSTPPKAKKGSSWLGMPPMPLRRSVEDADTSRTFDPPARLRVARAAVELCRVVPVMCGVALAVLVVAALVALTASLGLVVAALLSGVVLLAAGALAAVTATVAKWALVGRFRVSERPLWSSFVWRAELADTFVEVLAVPWLVGSLGGTPLLSAWLRSMGARIGRGAWLETYWLPESDLVRIGDGATVNRGCVVQTHLFHDRIMSMDTVVLDEGATLGPHGIVLPGAGIGARTTIGPGSLVTRGDVVPADTRWQGNAIAAWR
ncbi:amino acid adenylation protein [Prauserella sp. PE36]|uniref:Amino acid adenylation domain-containing protein n=1 Tax=Prauserella endophytica TaxID=1592324 RepID=A0ABY2RTH1_9PSEU|nr:MULTISPECIES: Pls/PosA family non-ribosomal peptide synthetase [Prauserella]RBM13347.1 amino acid adenylation protein [Prauserella sp. PE36]TKG60024.1 amino acid adenylation domain-containing protein [Prauserella endophytica]